METNFSPIKFKDSYKEEIQRKAYAIWEEKKFKGTLEIATGVGKTMIGLMAIQQEIDAKWWIVVSKIDLQEQWISEIKTHLKLGDDMIGRVGNGFDESDKSIVVAIVNSVRDRTLDGNLIMDEMHRYGSEENFKFLSNGTFNKILGLTATVIRQDGAHTDLLRLAPLVFTFSQKEAIDGDILSPFELTNIMVGLTQEERLEYMKANYVIKKDFGRFGNNLDTVINALNSGGLEQSIARALMGAITKRKSILHGAKSKVDVTVSLINNNPDSKIWIFCELIDTVEKIASKLKMPISKYHSNMIPGEAKKMLADFKENKTRILVSAKSLDEGTDVPDCDTMIITSGTKVERQMIQRSGRGLRKVEGKDFARIYQLYIPHSPDYDWMKARLLTLSKNAKRTYWVDGLNNKEVNK